MTRTQFAKRQARIAEGRCPRCDKPVDSWPLRRPENCGLSINTCMRQWADIHAAEAALTVKD